MNHTFLARSFGLYKESLRVAKEKKEVNVEYERKLLLSKAKAREEAMADLSEKDREKEERVIKGIKREAKRTENIATARDENEKKVLEMKVRRMKSAMHKVVSRSNQEFI